MVDKSNGVDMGSIRGNSKSFVLKLLRELKVKDLKIVSAVDKKHQKEFEDCEIKWIVIDEFDEIDKNDNKTW